MMSKLGKLVFKANVYPLSMSGRERFLLALICLLTGILFIAFSAVAMYLIGWGLERSLAPLLTPSLPADTIPGPLTIGQMIISKIRELNLSQYFSCFVLGLVILIATHQFLVLFGDSVLGEWFRNEFGAWKKAMDEDDQLDEEISRSGRW